MQANGRTAKFASNIGHGVRPEILVGTVSTLTDPAKKAGSRCPCSPAFLFFGATQLSGRPAISEATWFSTPHHPKGRISAPRLCSSNGKYGSLSASTDKSELKGVPRTANETVVPRGKKPLGGFLSNPLEYIRSRSEVEQGRPSYEAGELNLNFRREKG